jgi:small conductance mechanosensitive channel
MILLSADAAATFESIWNIVAPILWVLVQAVLVLIIGKKLIGVVIQMIKRVSEKGHLEKGVVSFICSLTKIILYVILIVIIAGIFGIPTASFIAIIGSCGLAIGLALQGSLQNFAGGVLILVMKPFVVGDYITVSGLEGTVSSIDICYTKLKTFDNKIVILPNGTLSNANLVNVSHEPTRRLDLEIPISYEDDIREVKTMLTGIVDRTEGVLSEPNKEIVVLEFGDSSIKLGVRVWVKTENYWNVKFELQEEIKYAMDNNGFTIPFQQIDVTVKNAESHA